MSSDRYFNTNVVLMVPIEVAVGVSYNLKSHDMPASYEVVIQRVFLENTDHRCISKIQSFNDAIENAIDTHIEWAAHEDS